MYSYRVAAEDVGTGQQGNFTGIIYRRHKLFVGHLYTKMVRGFPVMYRVLEQIVEEAED